MVDSLNGKLRRCTARSALAAFVALAVAPTARAQWLLPLGAAPPGEIEQRLRAQGFALTGPLYRRNSVYLADVNGGPAGRERLIIDAWSGEILQRFIVRRGHWRQGFGGEFAEPLPPGVVGPPPASEFFDGGPVHATEERIGPKPKSRPTAASRQPAQAAPPAQAVSPAQPQKPQDAGANATATKTSPTAPAPVPEVPPATAAAPAAPVETAKPNPPTPDATAAPVETAKPNPPTEATPAAQPEKPSSASSSAETRPAAPSATPVPSGAATQEAPKADAHTAASPETELPKTASPAQTQAQSASAAKPSISVPHARASDKWKVNDVPVIPLE